LDPDVLHPLFDGIQLGQPRGQAGFVTNHSRVFGHQIPHGPQGPHVLADLRRE
jgi:hypothetical protein